jgi:hypothetical protein
VGYHPFLLPNGLSHENQDKGCILPKVPTIISGQPRLGSGMRVLFVICIVTLLSSINAEDSLFHADHNLIFGLAKSLPVYGNETVHRVADKLQMPEFSNEHTSILAFKRTNKPIVIFGYLEESYPMYQLKPHIRDEIKKHFDFPQDQSVNLYGFRVWPGSTKSQLNVGRYLNSACRQETDNAYASDSTNFISLQPKNMHEFNRRLWISAGYAASYAYKNNPFGGSKMDVIGTYIAECFFASYIVGAPIFGRHIGDRVGFAALGVLGVLEVKLFDGGQLRRDVQIYNMLADGPYRVPREVRP